MDIDAAHVKPVTEAVKVRPWNLEFIEEHPVENPKQRLAYRCHPEDVAIEGGAATDVGDDDGDVVDPVPHVRHTHCPHVLPDQAS